MRTVEDIRPRPGLSVPVVTVLDGDGGLIEEGQRSLVRFVVQDGYGADVIFAAGTTGEWDRLPPSVNQRVIQVCTEEVRKLNSGHGDRGVEVWGGITAREGFEIIRLLEGLDIVAADINTVSPPHDPAGMSALLAGATTVEIFYLLSRNMAG